MHENKDRNLQHSGAESSDGVYLALRWVTSKSFKGFLRKGYFIFLIFIYLAALGLSYGMWDLVPQPGIKPRPPALRAWSLSHWTNRKSLRGNFKGNFLYILTFHILI